MSINKLALIRYKTIDNCLRNHYRKWTLQDLVEACSQAIYEYEGIDKGISLRTVQLDIQNMRSEKLGYHAPIVVTDKKYYSYEDKQYSITNTPLTLQDLGTLNEVLAILKQFKGFGYFQELNSMVTRLEDKLYKQQHKGHSYIDLEKNELLRGLEHIDPLHKAIIHQRTLMIFYKSFKARQEQQFIFYPYLLKEYRNRWFLLGMERKGKTVSILALDRIREFHELHNEKYVRPHFHPESFFSDVIGVSKTLDQKTHTVVLKIDRQYAPYVITKPLHQSQEILEEDEEGLLFSIKVIWNFELERELLGFGEQIRIVSPKRLATRIQKRMLQTLQRYEQEDLS